MGKTISNTRQKKSTQGAPPFLEAFFYSLPIQLLILHLKKNQLLILCWVFLGLLVTQQFGKLIGIPYLFLDPEYLNKVGFRSFFIIGIALGGFTVAFHITCYILDGHKFNFIGSLKRPFGKFAINNSIIPFVITIIYVVAIIRFQLDNEYTSYWDVVKRVCGLLSGMIFMIGVLFLYFRHTNKDIYKLVAGSVDEALKGIKISRRTRMNRLKEVRLKEHRCDNYFDYSLKARSTKGLTEGYDKNAILKVFDQNHFNSVMIELGIIFLILILGWFIDIEFFQIPAAASCILILTILIMVLGLISYWTGAWSFTVSIALFLLLNALWKGGFLKRENEAFGMNYDVDRANYTKEDLAQFSSIERYGSDKIQTLSILENWRNKQSTRKPPVVLTCVSGGGQRAALWTFNTLQKIDSALKSDFFRHTPLITGASGGMVGAAYYRELYHLGQLGAAVDLQQSEYRQNIAMDNLNPIIFSLLVNDIFLRRQSFKYGGYNYSKNRGYAFENQFNKNTKFILDKKLIDYKQPEADGLIPMMILAPTIINDGRKLYISPQNVSYMTLANEAVAGSKEYQVTGVDFINFFSRQDASNLRFLTALRMNATFPYITPNIRLPSNPQIEIMDAGIADNFGISDALRFLYVFRDWFSQNTSQVILLSIRDTEKDPQVDPTANPSIIQRIGAPISSVYNNLANIQDLNNDRNVEFAGTWYEGELQLIEIEYNTSSIFENQDFLTLNRELQEKETERASLSWHLTEKEKRNIISRIDIPENKKAIEQLKTILIP